MFDDDEGPKDWEIEDEEPPEQLRKKWEQEEAQDSKAVICSFCKKETPAENLTCLFCGTDLYFKSEGDQCRPAPTLKSVQGLVGTVLISNFKNKKKISTDYHLGKEIKSLGGATVLQESCPVRCFLTWIKHLLKRS